MTRESKDLPALPGWPEHPRHADWASARLTDRILGLTSEGRGVSIPRSWVRASLGRILEMREIMRKEWVGLDRTSVNQGHLTDWLLACMIARESGLLLGGPGTAKSEIAERTFSLLGLAAPRLENLPRVPTEDARVHTWWEEREAKERGQQKYFSYLLSRFTEPEEIFGPIEIGLLRRGVLVRVNFGMLTGPGVRAAFLDEVFKASSSILNSMLRLILNREHFNWGGMRRSDLLLFIAASNELPGGLATGNFGVGASGEDFQTLYAFLDRFPMRLEIPMASATNTSNPSTSHLALASGKAITRETAKFTTGELFSKADWKSVPPCLNDVLLIGRAMLQRGTAEDLFDKPALDRFETMFFKVAADLQVDGTGTRPARISWTISPRKLKALWKIALAHAIVRDGASLDDGFAAGKPVVEGPEPGHDLHAFDFVWDTPLERPQLERRVRDALGQR